MKSKRAGRDNVNISSILFVLALNILLTEKIYELLWQIL